MMVSNGEFYKDIQRTKNILDSYCIFKNLYREDPKSEHAKYGYENYSSLVEMLEKSCTEHITVVLGINPYTKVYDYRIGEYIPMKYRRCLCCGKQLPLDLEIKDAIDLTDIEDDIEIDPENLHLKYFEVLEEFVNAARRTNNKEEAIEELKKIVNKKNEESKKLKKIS